MLSVGDWQQRGPGRAAAGVTSTCTWAVAADGRSSGAPGIRTSRSLL